MIVTVEKIERALDVFKDGRAITFGEDFCEVCECVCVALNKLLEELEAEGDRSND